MERKRKSYFFKSFLTIVIAVGVFFVLKQYLPNRLFPENNSDIEGIVIDSLALAAMANDEDTLTYATTGSIEPKLIDTLVRAQPVTPTNQNVEEAPKVVSPIEENRPVEPSVHHERDTLLDNVHISSSKNSEGFGNLARFYDKLYELEKSGKGKVRIAYFGDSMTDGDLIVQDVRSAYQNEYGGKGVGFVGITSLSASARYSVTHQYSKNWVTQSFLKIKKPKRAFGIDGHVSFAPRGAETWIRYSANNLANATELYNPTLFYGSSSNHNGKVSVTLGKDSTVKYDLKTDKMLNTLKLSSNVKSLKATFQKADSIPFYGINFDDGKGVHVDNFSLRGNSGLPLALFNQNLMNALDRELNYNLIILQYGTNVLGYGTTDYTWYQNRMAAVVRHLHQCFPNAAILIVSTGDRAVKTNMEMKTDKAVEPLVKHQRLYAEKTNSGFVNLYTLMGGYGSMVEWVKKSPSLANRDYTHFNQRGAKQIGNLIYNELNRGYIEYKKLKESGKIPSHTK